MKNLLKFEFRKLFQMKTLYIFTVVIVAVLAMNIGTYKIMEVLLRSAELEAVIGMDLGMLFADTFDGKTFLTSALIYTEAVISLAVVVSLINCSDYASGTIKNIFSKGYSRMQVLFSKITVSAFVTAIFTIVSWIFGFIIGSVFWQDIGTDWNIIILYNLIVQFLLMLAYCAMFCFLASVIKKTAGTIVLSIVIPITSEILFMIINVLVNKKDFNINDYWIQGNITNITNVYATNSEIFHGLIIAIVYIAIFTLLNVWVSRKREV